MAKARNAPDSDEPTPQTKQYRNLMDHPVEVLIGDAGRFVESGGFVDLTEENVKVPHNKSMIDDGYLRKV